MSSGSHPLTIFREYICQQKYFPTEIINAKTQEFDFILGFARETGTGQFEPTWNYHLSAEKVENLKGRFPYVRVVISIGGIGSEFNPVVPEEEWITNAVCSIKEIIIRQYNKKIDGIDIHYDDIKQSNEDAFVSCIGEVIKRLKNDPELSIKVVSIAPTKNVQDQYRTLYSENRDLINWVNYRFYNQTFTTVEEFTQFYNDVVVPAYTGKVLVGVSNPRDPIIFDCIIPLLQNKSMRGAFVWNADESADAHVPFSLEKELQNL